MIRRRGRSGRSAGTAVSLFAAVALAVGTAAADAPARSSPPPSSPAPHPSPAAAPHASPLPPRTAPFRAGERLVFRMTYAHLLAGHAAIAVETGTRDGV